MCQSGFHVVLKIFLFHSSFIHRKLCGLLEELIASIAI